MRPWYVLVIMAVLAGLLSRCEGPAAPVQIGPHTPEQFNALSRAEQVQTCAGCHQEAYENELKGPHAHTYFALDELKDYMAHEDYHLQFYADFVGRSREVQCMGCHAPEDLFSAFYVDHLTAPDSLIASWHVAKPKLPKPRSKGQETGVDCLTCHYDGNRVITSGDFGPTASIAPDKSCSPMPSAFFGSDHVCFSCHSVSFEGSEAPLPLADRTDSQGPTCISCHQEYDAQGKGTHYFYWKNDPADKPKPPHLSNFFAPCAAVRTADAVEVKWMNALMPHPMSRAPEWYLDIALTDTAGHVLKEQRAYINRKENHDRTVVKTFGKDVLPGTLGFDPEYKGDTLTVVLPWKGRTPSEHLRIRTSAFSKSQYWHHDSIGTRQAEHVVEVE